MASSPRPDPTFADQIATMPVSNDREMGHLFGKDQWSFLKKTVINSEKYVLTPDAARTIIEAMKSYPEQLVHNSKFARPPHDTIWLEVKNIPPPGLPERAAFATEYNTGYLVHNGTLYTFMTDALSGGIYSQLWVVDLHTPATRDDQKLITDALGFTIDDLDRAYWGRNLIDSIPDHLRGRLRQDHRARPMPGKVASELRPGDWTRFNQWIDVNVRMVLATLLALNQPRSVINIATRDAQRRMTARGPQKFFAHNVVTITLGVKAEIRFDYGNAVGGGWTNRWHRVDGHYVTDRKARTSDCTHGFGLPNDWWVAIESADGKERWECLGCGGKRTWRTYPNGRGNGAKGMSLHHHVIKTPDDD